MKKFEIQNVEIIDDGYGVMLNVETKFENEEYLITLQKQEGDKIEFEDACDDDKYQFCKKIIEDGEDETDVEAKILEQSHVQEIYNKYIKDIYQ